MQSVASVPKKAVVVPQRAVHREVEVQEEVPHAVVHQEAVTLHQESRTVVAAVPAVMKIMISTHHAVVAEAVGDNG